MNLRALAKDTFIYGMSSIVGRFLNYLLVPLYTYKIAAGSGGYGIITNLYANTALMLAILTFGMETTLFRFSNKEDEDPRMVYGTALRMTGVVVLAFITLVAVFLGPISSVMGYPEHPEYIALLAVNVGFDAFQAIMFSRLRQQGRSIKFMCLKFAFIIPNILLNLFIFLAMPQMFGAFPALEQLYCSLDNGVGLIFAANLICTTMVFLGFIPELKGLGYGFDRGTAVRMLRYTWPLLLLSLFGILNQNADKILFPYLMPGPGGRVQLGIYGACVKIAMIMALLTQAFRYAYEPIVFNGSRDRNNPETLASGMKYFIFFTLLAYLAVMFYLPLLKYFVNPQYWEGLGVIPVVMAAEIFMGIYFNLSFWYKLIDQTWWGAVISALGAVVMIAVNVAFVPRFGYWACAWGGFAGYAAAMLASLALGHSKYPVPYEYGKIFAFTAIAAAAYGLSAIAPAAGCSTAVSLVIDTLILVAFAALIFREIKTSTKI